MFGKIIRCVVAGTIAAGGLAAGGTTYVSGNDGQLVEVKEGGAQRVVGDGIGMSRGIALDGKGNAYTADMMGVLRTALATGATETLTSEEAAPSGGFPLSADRPCPMSSGRAGCLNQ